MTAVKHTQDSKKDVSLTGWGSNLQDFEMSIVIAQDTVRNGLVHCNRQGRVTGSAHRDGAGAARKYRVAGKH